MGKTAAIESTGAAIRWWRVATGEVGDESVEAGLMMMQQLIVELAEFNENMTLWAEIIATNQS